MRQVRVLMSLALALLLANISAYAQSKSGKSVSFARTTTFAPGAPANSPISNVVLGPDVDTTFDIPGVSGNNSPARLPADFVPRPAGNGLGSASFTGFAGLSQFQQAIAFTGVAGGANGQLEPPDQGLAVGNGFVVEAVNNAIEIFQTSGQSLGFEALSAFFGLPPTFTLNNKGQIVSFGPFLSDPRALFDAVNGHFFVTEIEIDTNSQTGALASTSHLLIAVSQTNNPAGNWNVFTVDVSNDGDTRFGGCPTGCFGDQPLIGADANGFYISTNAFALPPGRFKGAQVYAISLAELESGSSGPIADAVHFGNLDVVAGIPARSINPASVPPGGAFETGAGGTEYFVSALDPAHTVDNRVAVWALTNTSSLNETANLNLTDTIVTTEAYGFPPATDQQTGPTPFRDFLATLGFKNHEELVAGNDDRMQQVVFANGMLWTAVPTKIQPAGQGPVRAGAAWFILTPSVSGGLSASVFNQGYVSIQSPMQNSVLFPAVAVNASGKAAIVFSVAGENFFPSAAFATLDASAGAGPIVITAAGVAPDDGFSAYAPFAVGARAGRWGDYSAAAADEAGNLWMATEMIPTGPNLPAGVLAANNGTFITEFVP